MAKGYLNLKGSFFSNIQVHSDAALLFWFNVRQRTCILLKTVSKNLDWLKDTSDGKMNFWYGKGRLIWKKDLTTIDWPMGWSRMIDDDLIDRKWDLIKNSCNSFSHSCKNADLNPDFGRTRTWLRWIWSRFSFWSWF